VIGLAFAVVSIGLVIWRLERRHNAHAVEANDLKERLATARERHQQRLAGQSYDFEKAVLARKRKESAEATRQKAAARLTSPKADRRDQILSNFEAERAKRRQG
jgi:hypothetical protein